MSELIPSDYAHLLERPLYGLVHAEDEDGLDGGGGRVLNGSDGTGREGKGEGDCGGEHRRFEPPRVSERAAQGDPPKSKECRIIEGGPRSGLALS